MGSLSFSLNINPIICVAVIALIAFIIGIKTTKHNNNNTKTNHHE